MFINYYTMLVLDFCFFVYFKKNIKNWKQTIVRSNTKPIFLYRYFRWIFLYTFLWGRSESNVCFMFCLLFREFMMYCRWIYYGWEYRIFIETVEIEIWKAKLCPFNSITSNFPTNMLSLHSLEFINTIRIWEPPKKNKREIFSDNKCKNGLKLPFTVAQR